MSNHVSTQQEHGYYDTYDDYDETQEDAPMADVHNVDEPMQDIYTARSQSSTRRYPRYVPTIATPRTIMRVTHHQGAPIQRASLRQPHTTRTHAPTQESVTPPPLARSAPRSTRTRAHWITFVSGGMLLAFLLLGLFSFVSHWWQQTQETMQYGSSGRTGSPRPCDLLQCGNLQPGHPHRNDPHRHRWHTNRHRARRDPSRCELSHLGSHDRCRSCPHRRTSR